MTSQHSPFLNGWRTLPDELKLNILQHALPHGQILEGRYFDIEVPNQSKTKRLKAKAKFEVEALSLLNCPEITGFVIEVLYSQNIVSTVIANPKTDFKPSLPSAPALRYIRHLQLSVEISEVCSGALAELVNTKLGQCKLQHIELVISDHCDYRGSVHVRLRRGLNVMPALYFPTKVLTVTYYAGDVIRNLFRTRRFPPDLERPLLEKLSIAGNDVKEAWERCYEVKIPGHRAKMVEVIDDWPEVDLRGRHPRRTTKVVWT